MKKRFLICGSACAAACILLLILAFAPRFGGKIPEQDLSAANQTPAPVSTPRVSEEISPPPSEAVAYESPIDFEELQELNPDIYAWLDIPGTETSYPVLQSSTDDTFYLRRGIDGKKLTAGSLFTEHTYNGTDFTDPVTIIYGHRMNSGAMFGSLQTIYSDAESFAEYNEIVIYLPDQELHYQVFAGVPYDNRHILYNYDFEDTRVFNAFFASIFSTRSLTAHIDQECELTSDSHVLILSTCLRGDNTQRFLVMAKLVEPL